MEPFMDLELIRTQSLQTAERLGYNVIESLPRLDEAVSTRSLDETVKRLLCLHAAAAGAYGFDRKKAWSWLQQEDATQSLAASERQFLEQGIGDPNRFKIQIEGMWALAWVLDLTPHLDFGKDCDGRFAALLPNLKVNENSSSLRRRAKLRSVEEIIRADDLAYCLHWSVRQAQLDGSKPPGHVQPYVVEERRRSLDWMLSNEHWDDVSLDT